MVDIDHSMQVTAIKQQLMNKKLPSAPSIQACLEELQRKQEEREYASKQQYLNNLKTQCQIRENALRTAQSLIVAYQKENEGLKQQNHQLQERLQMVQEKMANYQSQGRDMKSMERSLLKYSQKINELLEKNIANEQRIHQLEKELERVNETQGQMQSIAAKAKLKTRQEKQRRQLEGQFKNYLRLPQGEESSFASSIEKREGNGGERRVLQWKLKQKDEQVMILLKRLKDTQQRLDGMMGRKGRHLTYDSIDAASTKQSKKMNISQFEH